MGWSRLTPRRQRTTLRRREGSATGYGDEILAAGQAQRHYDATGQPSVIVDLQGRPRWHSIWDRNPAVLAVTHVHPDHHTIRNGPNCRPYYIPPFTAESGWTFDRSFRARENIARIYLTPAEYTYGEVYAVSYAPFVLFDPWSKHPNLRWPLAHWQRLIDLLPHITFLQQQYRHAPAVLNGAIGAATDSFRDACGLLAHASLYIRGESGMNHAAAALNIPTVTIWGGCMDWEVLGGYPLQTGVGISPEPPCGRYLPCQHCTETMAAISPETVAEAVQQALLRSAMSPTHETA